MIKRLITNKDNEKERMSVKTLHLVLKRKWWDMIASGEKPDEYRRITPHHCSRLLNTNNGTSFVKTSKSDFDDFLALTEYEYAEFVNYVRLHIKRGDFDFREYDAVCFHRGYTNITMLYELKGTSIGYGNPAWGAPEDEEVFIIKLGKRQ